MRQLYTKSGFLSGLISRPERELVGSDVESAGLGLVASPLSFMLRYLFLAAIDRW